MLSDREYQTQAVDSIWRYFTQGGVGNPGVLMPTGTGKSVVIARFLHSVFSQFPFQRVMLLTHVKELIQQNFEKLMMYWPFAPAGVYSAGLNSRDYNKPIIFAGIASVAKRPELFGHIDLVLIDEAHLVSPNEATMYRRFLAALKAKNPVLKIIWFTATGYRLGHGMLTDPYTDPDGNEVPSIFTDVCFDITTRQSFNRLIAEGYLAPLLPRRPKSILNADGLHMRGGDFIESELQNAPDLYDISELALREAAQIAQEENRKAWLIFATGVDHAEAIGGMLDAMGISCGVVHSKRSDRDKTIAAFKAGHLTAVVNNNVLTTGFDHPLIDLILGLRMTMSPVLWVQMMGRGTRPYYGLDGKGLLADGTYANLDDIGGRLAASAAGPKQNCRVLDYAANSRRLGPINDPVVPTRKGKGGGTAPVKVCDRCGAENHISLKFCYECGFEFTFEVKVKQEASTQEVIAGDMPVTEVFKVDHISYSEHQKKDKPPCVKVSYYCGYNNVYMDFIMPQHEHWARRNSAKLWREGGGGELPETTADALEMAPVVLTAVTHLRVWTNNKPYPTILQRCYDGTAFGTEAAGPPPYVEGPKSRAPKPLPYDPDEDDVPF